MKNIETIANAGNTEVPCFLATKSLGFRFSKLHEKTDQELWVAENQEIRFVASNQLELLGLIYMRELRGKNWKASDEEIDNYLSKYYPEALEE
ncbi:hypothetical protein D1AOALGA4SA_3256 [Olavius algarvensis Delta 1 endosymbiont]|nr:hypothetical protein D1AOALGA4SA_3256 [Olavius algarvensis Delta 1 endosymbiont]